jgi:hypothetical protein
MIVGEPYITLKGLIELDQFDHTEGAGTKLLDH